jgi:DNA topoisomerase-3
MGDENIDLVKEIFNKLKTAYAEQSAGALEAAITGNNKRLFNSAELQDHHALLPLAVLPSGASKAEADVYGLVLNRFFITLKPPYIYHSITILVNIQKHIFTGNGIEIIQSGWKKGIKNENDDNAQSFAGVQENGSYPVEALNVEEKYTEPKKHYTYATLLQLMENPRNEDGKHLVGLGTPATRGSILKTLADRQYMSLQGKSILITDKGKFLINVIYKNPTLKQFISIPESTRWEEQLHSNADVFLAGIKSFVKNVVKTTIAETYQKQETSLGKCPLCGNLVREGQKNYYCGGYKNGCKFSIWKEVSHASISSNEAAALLAGKKTRIKKCKNKDGKQFEARFYLQDGQIKFDFGR